DVHREGERLHLPRLQQVILVDLGRGGARQEEELAHLLRLRWLERTCISSMLPVLEPAAASEECEEREEGGDLAADAEDEEHGPAVDVGNHPVEVLAEKTGDERQRQKDGGDDRQLLHHRVDSIRDG